MSDYTFDSYLQYVASYDDLCNELVYKFNSDFTHNIFIINEYGKFHYENHGLNELNLNLRKYQTFDAWNYVANFPENIHEYYDFDRKSLNFDKIYYHYIVIGYLNQFSIKTIDNSKQFVQTYVSNVPYSKYKVAVITQSYHRKNESTKTYLNNMFKMLEKQTYKNFKVFITGDDYNPFEELKQACDNYKGVVSVCNNNHSCRTLKLGNIRNYWCVGGIHALVNSYTRAKNEGYNILLLLDDDDTWYKNHIETVIEHFYKYPDTGFMITRAKYSRSSLPRTHINTAYYNNYIPKPCDSVKAATIHNISVMGDDVLHAYRDMIKNIDLVHNSVHKKRIVPGDAQILRIIGHNVKNNKYKSLYVPITTVSKKSDCNWKHIKLE